MVPERRDHATPQNGTAPTDGGPAGPVSSMPPAQPGRFGPLRRISITLTPAGLVSSALLLCMGFVAVFALGILIGRGHNPEAGIPELARIMPDPAPRSAPNIIDGAESPSRESPPDAPGIIEQGDLAYREHLKLRPDQQSGKNESPAPKAAPPAPQAQQTRQKAEAAPKTPPAEQTKPEQRPKSPDTQIYHYSYQAASFTDRPSCDAFGNKLKQAGFKARTEQVEANGKTWFRVMVDFTGRPDDTDALRDKLKQHGVPKALLRGKTPAQ